MKYRRINANEQLSSCKSYLRSWNASSSVSPGTLPVHILVGVGPWVAKGSSTINPTDCIMVPIHSGRPLNRPNLGPGGGGDKRGKQWKK